MTSILIFNLIHNTTKDSYVLDMNDLPKQKTLDDTDIFTFLLYQKVGLNLVSQKKFIRALDPQKVKQFNGYTNDKYYRKMYSEYQDTVYRQYQHSIHNMFDDSQTKILLANKEILYDNVFYITKISDSKYLLRLTDNKVSILNKFGSIFEIKYQIK